MNDVLGRIIEQLDSRASDYRHQRDVAVSHNNFHLAEIYTTLGDGMEVAKGIVNAHANI